MHTVSRRRARRAAFLAVNIERRSAMNDQVARAMAALAEMRRRAEEFSWRKPATVLKSTGVPVCHGTGHTGAI